MEKNLNHHTWNQQGGLGIDSMHSFECPNGYYPVDNGRYCQQEDRGPSGLTRTIPGRRRRKSKNSSNIVPARLVTNHFRGSFDDLIDKIIDLNESYFNTLLSRTSIQRSVNEFRENAMNGYIEDNNCVNCIGTHEFIGVCIGNICVTNWELRANRNIKCELKLRY